MTDTDTDKRPARAAKLRRAVLDRFERKLDKYLPDSGDAGPWKLGEVELALLDDMNELACGIIESRIGADPNRTVEKPKCPECGLALGVVLWRSFDYFDDNRERIRYDEFRRKGLPLAHEGQVPQSDSCRTWSSQVESAIGQTNDRVKAAKKSWFLEHADEMLALRTQALSEDGRWEAYFQRLRRGEIDIPTRIRMERLPVFPSKKQPAMDPAA